MGLALSSLNSASPGDQCNTVQTSDVYSCTPAISTSWSVTEQVDNQERFCVLLKLKGIGIIACSATLSLAPKIILQWILA